MMTRLSASPVARSLSPRGESVRHRGRRTGRNHRHRHARQGDGRANVSRQAALFALCGARLPDPALFRRHAHAHLVFDGRGRIRRAARPEGSLSFRQRRGGHGVQRAARQAVPPAGFPRGDRPLGRHGIFPQLIGGDPGLLSTPQGRKWYDEINSGKGAQAAVDIITSFGKGQMPKGFPVPGTPSYRSAWRETIKAAEEANEPGRFTAFIGYEWTSNAGGNNLHRNVIWRDNGAKASLVEPYTTLPPLGSPNPRDLWKWMAATEEKTGAELLAIAHNGNLSNGRMFPIIKFVQQPAYRSRVCREPGFVGSRVRDHADQGRRRDASVSLAQRRVRELRALGQGEPGPH